MRVLNNIASWRVVSVLMSGIVAGFGIALLTVPVPKQNDGCGVYKVNMRPVTSFVLKTPQPAQPEKPICPVAPKCEPQAANPPESVRQADPNNVDESKPRRHRRHHYRVRSYWR